jgi:hypothetical protein
MKARQIAMLMAVAGTIGLAAWAVPCMIALAIFQ